jgi:hypothetical protein
LVPSSVGNALMTPSSRRSGELHHVEQLLAQRSLLPAGIVGTAASVPPSSPEHEIRAALRHRAAITAGCRATRRTIHSG